MSGPLRYGLTTVMWIQCEQQGKGLVINNWGGGGVRDWSLITGRGRGERTPPVCPDHRYVDTV